MTSRQRRGWGSKVFLLTEQSGMTEPDPVGVFTELERAQYRASQATMSKMPLQWRRTALPAVVENRQWQASPSDTAEFYHIREMDLDEVMI